MVDLSKLFEEEAQQDAALKEFEQNSSRNYLLNRLPVDNNPGFTHTYIPGWAAQDEAAVQNDVNPRVWFPSVQQGIENVKAIYNEGADSPENIKNKLFGTGGVERYQTWPEKMVRSGISLPGDVMSGQVLSGPGLRAIDYSDIPGAPQPLNNLIERTQDLAGLAAGGSVVSAAPAKATLRSGFARRLSEHLESENPYTTDVFHGTTKNNRDNIRSFGLNIGDENSAFVTNSPKDAYEFALMKAKGDKTNSKVMRGQIDDSKFKTVDVKGEIYDPDMMKSILEKAKNEGYPGVKIKNIQNFEYGEPSTSWAIFNTTGIKLAEDSEAGTAIGAARNSFANRLNEHLNAGNESMPEILARQRASEGYEAAIRDPETKKLYTGMWHEEVLDKMAKDKGISKDQLPTNIVKGYIDYNGRFLTEAQLEKRSQSKSAMFRSDDEAGTAIVALNTKLKKLNDEINIYERKGVEDGVTEAPKHLYDELENTQKQLSDLKSNQTTYKQKLEDIKDAKSNLGEWAFNSKNFKHDAGKIQPYFDKLAEPHKIERIPIDQAKIFHDWGRRITDKNRENPVIAMKLPEGGYQILDGQHRVMTKKEAGEKYINASVVDIPWNKGMIRNGKQTYYLSDDLVGTGLAALAPRFYSGVEKAIANTKAEKLAPDQWLGPRTERTYVVKDPKTGQEKNVTEVKYGGTLGNMPGVNIEEIEHLKLPEWIEEQKKAGKKSISKEEIQNYLNENKVELDEKVLGGINIDKYHKDLEQIAKSNFNSEYDHLSNKDAAAVRRDALRNQGVAGEPRYAQYQLPGGSNYRELLLSLKDNPVKLRRVQEINDEINNIDKQLKSVKDKGKFDVENADNIEKLKNRKMELARERLDLENAFTTDHWPGTKDIVVHSRMNDRFIPDEKGSSLRSDANYGIRPFNGEYQVFEQVGQDRKGIQKFKTEDEAKNFINNQKGYNTLHAEEIQSDLHQKGNSEGYRLSLKEKNKLEPEFNRIEEKIVNSGDEQVMSNPDLKEAVKSAVDKKIITEAEAKVYLRYSNSERYGAVKDAPFKSTWSDLMVKRLIRQAAEEDKDAISWTPGQVQIDRYPGLQQHFDRIEYNPKTEEFKAYDKKGILAAREHLNKSKLVDYIGKEATDKLINNPTKKTEIVKKKSTEIITDEALRKIEEAIEGKPVAVKEGEKQYLHTLDNADLKVGGEFHKKFYDEILVNKVNAIAKKYGARVEEKNLTEDNFKEIRNKLANEQYGIDYEMLSQRDQRAIAEKAFGMNNKVWFLKLTPELKKAALEKGFSMFETGLPLTPVSHDPFSEQKKKFKLIPIQGNPFQ